MMFFLLKVEEVLGREKACILRKKTLFLQIKMFYAKWRKNILK